ncbi:hypothetical protein [Xenorhabdus thuongxuanensis]|uniref:Primosomal replication protein PriB/PriC domain protein n=1 Tax=Xenorhabdus thuongxuanensis TaxID=1873484 RepID=A0A1Q5U3T1_9GAMM|nr:hypothetical protein [Xenorhabdus thuongxuanensis]OKP07127.1 hypothetical protein Xentx_01731 [Xenorhabdus thuongxuanensis]
MTQEEIEHMIQQYLDAEKTVLQGKTLTFNGQSMTLENLTEIVKGRERWEQRLSALKRRKKGTPMYKLARF